MRVLSGVPGLFRGGLITGELMLNNTAEFGYYGILSNGEPLDELMPSAAQIAAVKQAQVWIGAGWQEPGLLQNSAGLVTGSQQQLQTLLDDGIPVTSQFINCGPTDGAASAVGYGPELAATTPKAPPQARSQRGSRVPQLSEKALRPVPPAPVSR